MKTLITLTLVLLTTASSWAQSGTKTAADLSPQFDGKNYFPSEDYLCGMHVEFKGDLLITREIINERIVNPYTASCDQWKACDYSPSFFKKVSTNVYVAVANSLGTPLPKPNTIKLSPFGSLILSHDTSAGHLDGAPDFHENLQGSDYPMICPAY